MKICKLPAAKGVRFDKTSSCHGWSAVCDCGMS